MILLAENLAQEIRDQEAIAKSIVSNAKAEAAKILAAKGEADAKSFYEKKKNETDGVANWLVREVMAAYGSRRNV